MNDAVIQPICSAMRLSLAVLSCILHFAFCVSSTRAEEKVTYQDHVLPIFRNTCLNCHNPDKKKGNLDLSTYSGAVTGGGSGKAFEPGDPDGSMIYKVISWSIEPNMPPKGDKIPEKDINLIRE